MYTYAYTKIKKAKAMPRLLIQTIVPKNAVLT